LCAALDVYVATPVVRTQLVSVTLFDPIVAAPVAVVPAELAAVSAPLRSSATAL
jgi:hypothetical protein